MTSRSNKIIIELTGRINSVVLFLLDSIFNAEGYRKWGAGAPPSRQFGFYNPYHKLRFLALPSGIMDHEEAKLKHTGGKILGFLLK